MTAPFFATCGRGIEPILADLEGQTTALGAPVDPSTVKLVGTVGQPASYLGKASASAEAARSTICSMLP